MKKSKEKDESKYVLTPQGSLGILALGHIGIRQWREVVKQKKSASKKSKEENE